MKKECSKYEGLFVFSDEETLKQHLLECEECRMEQEKMDRVSELIAEVKPHYLAKFRKRPAVKAVCAFLLLIFSAFSFELMENYDDMTDTLRYGSTLSAEDLGFPVDSYGLIAIGDG